VTDTVLARIGLQRSWSRRFLGSYGQEIIVLLGIVFLFLLVGSINSRFMSDTNLNSIFSGNAYVAIAAIGMSMLIVSGHIDVSVGSMIGVIATIAGTLAVSGYPPWIAWIVPVLFAVAVNAVVGAFVAYLRIPSIVVTLGMLSILKGGLISATGGAWISDLPPGFMISQWRFFGIASPVYFMVILTIAAALFLNYTAFGRSIYAVGGNSEAARAAGVNPELTVVKVFALHGLFAGIAGLLFATQLQVIQSTVPPNLELTVITASVIGGVSILGGTGSVIGSTFAAILFATIGSALVFLNVSAYWLRSVLGLMILATVLADMIRRRRAT
jgi:ribose/xylose/arabinose/galactoside ABC-type transport system permease subunit